MEHIDGWAITIGDQACRFFSRNGHDGLEGILCSDGSYSAGWRVIAATVAVAVVGFIFFKLLKPNN